MGNDPSLPEHNGHRSVSQSNLDIASGNGSVRAIDNDGFEVVNKMKRGEPLPPMVLIVEAVVWSSTKDPGLSQMFYCAMLDGAEVGRAASYPSPSVRIAPCTMDSTVTLRFFAGLDGEGFMLKKPNAVDPRLVGEVSMPLNTIVQYGAPLYTSMWLGLPGDEAEVTTMELKQALEYAKSPVVPKVRVTIFKPAYEGFQALQRLENASLQNIPVPQGPQPDIQAVCSPNRDADAGWDACLGPSTPVHNSISKEQQLRGLVAALKHANDVACVWQRAIFCPPEDVQLAHRIREEAAREAARTREETMRRQRESRKGFGGLAPVSEDRDGASSVVSSGRQELERQFAAATMELERLRGVEEKQLLLQQDLELATTKLQSFWASESQHQEDIQQRLMASTVENEALRAQHQDYDVLTRKLEAATQENVQLKLERSEKPKGSPKSSVDLTGSPPGSQKDLQKKRSGKSLSPGAAQRSPSGSQKLQPDTHSLKMKCAELQDERNAAQLERDQALQREDALTAKYETLLIEKQVVMSSGKLDPGASAKFEVLLAQVDSLQSEKMNIQQREMQRQAQFNDLASENKELLQKAGARDALCQSLQEKLYVAEEERTDLRTADTARTAEQEDLREKLGLAEEDRQKHRERYELLAQRLNELESTQNTPTQSSREPEVVPMNEYEKVQMLYKEADQDREVLRARLEQLEQAVNVHERPVSLQPKGVSFEEFDALKEQLNSLGALFAQAEQDRDGYRSMAALSAKYVPHDISCKWPLSEVPEDEAYDVELMKERLGSLGALFAKAEQDRDAYKAMASLSAKYVPHDVSVKLPKESAEDSATTQDVEQLQAQLISLGALFAEAEQERDNYKAMASRAGTPLRREQTDDAGVSVEDYQALQQKLAATSEESVELSWKLTQVEEERNGYMELARAKDRWSVEENERKLDETTRQLEETRQNLERTVYKRDLLNTELQTSFSEISQLRSASDAQQKELETLRVEAQRAKFREDGPSDGAMATSMSMATEHFKERERALQGELSAALRSLDEAKREKQAALDTSRTDMSSSRDLGQAMASPPASRTSLGLSRHTSEEIMYQQGEKTMLGAKVSELRLTMKKKEVAHKEDVTKLNKELMAARAVSNQERVRRGDVERQLSELEQTTKDYEDRIQAEALRAEQMSVGDQELQREIGRLSGEVEAMRIRERQWQAIATNRSMEEIDAIEAEQKQGAVFTKDDDFILRLFKRLIWEKFSHFEPDDIHRFLKMDTRPSTIPKTEVDKVIKSYRAHQRNFSMAKAFRGLDVHRTGRLAPHEFELRLTQSLSLDVELSGHIYKLLNSSLHGDDANGAADADVPGSSPPGSASASAGAPRAIGRTSSARSIEEGMIKEEEFTNFFESKKI